MRYRVLSGAKAKQDILDLYDYIADKGHPVEATKYIDRLERWCLSLGTFPERGIPRDDIRTGLRTVGFERRVLVCFQITGNAVVILRLLYGGRDISGADFSGDTTP